MHNNIMLFLNKHFYHVALCVFHKKNKTNLFQVFTHVSMLFMSVVSPNTHFLCFEKLRKHAKITVISPD